MIANACVLHWNDKLQNTLQPLNHTVMMGIEVGDFEYACYSAMYYTLYSLHNGEIIESLQQKFKKNAQMMHSLKQSYQHLYSSVWQEFLENLTTQKESYYLLEGKYFSQKNTLQSLIDTNSFSILYNVYFAKSILALVYEEVDTAYEYITLAKNYHIGVASLYQFGEFFFYDAIIAYRYFKITSKIEKTQLVLKIEDAIEYYTMLCKSSLTNNEHKMQFLQALLLELQGDSKSWKSIDNTAKKAHKNGFIHIEAIINQFAFYFWEEEGMEDFATSYLTKANETYKKWGATKVSEYLEKRYISYLYKGEVKDKISLESFDLNTVFKASHALASERSLAKLLETMMSIIIENSASQTGYLFLESQEQFQLAIGYQNNQFSLKFEQSQLPLNIVNYVKRTGEDIIYSANDINDLISKDHYVQKNTPQSLFCTPIHYLGELKGVLFLENKDILNLYSKEKLNLLRLLSNQAAISIEQVKLFEKINQINNSLELQVDIRTKELQEQKEIFETLFYDTSEGITLIKGGKYIDCNNAIVKMLGYNSKEEFLSTLPSQSSPSLQPDGQNSILKAKEMIEICLRDGSHRFEWLLKTTSGKTFWVDISLTKLTMDGEIVIHSLWKDISTQKALEESLIDAKEKAESATLQKSEFLANMSHEIRTPMNGIIGMTLLAMQATKDKKQQNYLHKIDSSAKSLLGIINDILDFSKIEAGKLAIDKIDFDLFKTIDTVISLNELKAHEKNIELVVSYDTTIGKNFYGDPLRISQILTNLTSNALKFTDEGEVGIFIKKTNTNRFRFEVRDSGIGVDNKIKHKLFESFSQADGSTTRKYGGTGLGLAISKQLVELMNGKIWVESETEKGSSFFFEIELEQKEIHNKKYRVFQDKKVLIVDDNKTWQEILANLLRTFDIETNRIDSGKKAIEHLKNNNTYDLILMDWNMPYLDGIETTRIIKEQSSQHSAPTVIMVSAFRQESIVKLAKDVGIDIFLQKPINPSILNDILSSIFLDDVQINYTRYLNEGSLKYKLTTLKGSKILLVEDNLTNQEIIKGLLEESGIIIDIANNGAEALEIFSQNSYEMILMDIQMPIMDGYEATKRIKEQNPNIPIVALTANAMKEDIEKTKAANMNAHLNKPIDVEQLYKTLLQYIPKKCEINENDYKREKEMILSLDFKYIDTEKGLLHMANNEKLYLTILQKFVDSYKELDLESLDQESLKRETHAIKGLSANIGATSFHKIAKELDETSNKELLPLFYRELKNLINDIEKNIHNITTNQTHNRLEVSPKTKEELFVKLSDAIESNRPKNCEHVLETLEQYEFSKKETTLLNQIKDYVSKYQFKEAKEVLLKTL